MSSSKADIYYGQLLLLARATTQYQHSAAIKHLHYTVWGQNNPVLFQYYSFMFLIIHESGMVIFWVASCLCICLSCLGCHFWQFWPRNFIDGMQICLHNILVNVQYQGHASIQGQGHMSINIYAIAQVVCLQLKRSPVPTYNST